MYQLVNEYQDSYAYPPPINFIFYVILLYERIFKKERYSTFKSYLDEVDSDKKRCIYSFAMEKQCAVEYLNKLKNLIGKDNLDIRLKESNDKFEILEGKLNELIKENNLFKNGAIQIDNDSNLNGSDSYSNNFESKLYDQVSKHYYIKIGYDFWYALFILFFASI